MSVVLNYDGSRNALTYEASTTVPQESIFIESFYKFQELPVEIKTLSSVKLVKIKGMEFLDVAIRIKKLLSSVTTLVITIGRDEEVLLSKTTFPVLIIQAESDYNLLMLSSDSLEGVEKLTLRGTKIVSEGKIRVPPTTIFNGVRVDPEALDYSQVEVLRLVGPHTWITRNLLKLDAPNLKYLFLDDYKGINVMVMNPLQTLEVRTDKPTKIAFTSLESLVVSLRGRGLHGHIYLNKAPRTIVSFDAGVEVSFPEKSSFHVVLFGKDTEKMEEKSLKKVSRPGYYTQGRDLLRSPGGEVQILGVRGKPIGLLSRDALQFSGVLKRGSQRLPPERKWNSTAVAFLVQWLNYYVSPSTRHRGDGTSVVPMLALTRVVYLPDKTPLKILLKTAKDLEVPLLLKEVERLLNTIPLIKAKLRERRRLIRIRNLAANSDVT